MQTAKITEKNGSLAGLMTVKGDEDLMIITDTGVMIELTLPIFHKQVAQLWELKVMRAWTKMLKL